MKPSSLLSSVFPGAQKGLTQKCIDNQHLEASWVGTITVGS